MIVTVPAVPAASGLGKLVVTRKPCIAAGTTFTDGLVPVIALEAESVAMIDWLPAVLKAMESKTCDP